MRLQQFVAQVRFGSRQPWRKQQLLNFTVGDKLGPVQKLAQNVAALKCHLRPWWPTQLGHTIFGRCSGERSSDGHPEAAAKPVSKLFFLDCRANFERAQGIAEVIRLKADALGIVPF